MECAHRRTPRGGLLRWKKLFLVNIFCNQQWPRAGTRSLVKPAVGHCRAYQETERGWRRQGRKNALSIRTVAYHSLPYLQCGQFKGLHVSSIVQRNYCWSVRFTCNRTFMSWPCFTGTHCGQFNKFHSWCRCLWDLFNMVSACSETINIYNYHAFTFCLCSS